MSLRAGAWAHSQEYGFVSCGNSCFSLVTGECLQDECQNACQIERQINCQMYQMTARMYAKKKVRKDTIILSGFFWYLFATFTCIIWWGKKHFSLQAVAWPKSLPGVEFRPPGAQVHEWVVHCVHYIFWRYFGISDISERGQISSKLSKLIIHDT